MKELLTLTGGYPRQMDYMLNLQSEMLTLGNALFNTLGFDMVLAGCQVTDNHNGTVNIAAGLIYINGEVLRFDGSSNTPDDSSKTFAKSAYTTSDTLNFADGFPKNVYREAKAEIVNADILNHTQIKIKTTLYNFRQYVQDSVQAYEVKGTYKDVYDFDGTFRANFDITGLGVTPRWVGWALDNENNGTPGSVGRALIAAGTYTEPGTGDVTVYSNGDTTGERLHKLTIDEGPTPAGTPTSIDGPHPKPGDGGGVPEFYIRAVSAGAAAVAYHNNMQPSFACYRVIKIID